MYFYYFEAQNGANIKLNNLELDNPHFIDFVLSPSRHLGVLLFLNTRTYLSVCNFNIHFSLNLSKISIVQ